MHKTSETARRPIGQRVVALVAAGSLVSACAPMMPSVYPSANYTMGPYRPMWSGGYPLTPPPYAYRQPVAPGGYPVPAPQQQQATGSNIANDAVFGGAGYLAGRQFGQAATDPVVAPAAEAGEGEAAAARGVASLAADQTVATGVGVADTAIVARTVTVAGGAALGAGEIGAGAVAAEGGEVVAAAAVGEFLVPAVLIGGGAYLAYRALSGSSEHDH